MVQIQPVRQLHRTHETQLILVTSAALFRRPDLNNPPTSVGGIPKIAEANLCRLDLKLSTHCRGWDFVTLTRLESILNRRLSPSEDVSRRKLNLTRAAETEQSAKLIPDGRNTLTEECRWPQRVIIAPNQTAGRIGEICPVKEIEDLHTKLERSILR